MSHAEYRANLQGLNIFFGAVLGFVLAGTESLESWRFAFLLLISAGIVVSILYISASSRRLAYAGFTLAVIAALPLIADGAVLGAEELPPKLQPTLAVWVAMTILIEFLPRERAAPTKDAE